ncbi:F-box/kelch-repeat protein At1g57790-like [Lycium barbarum]|uniref:F-box/kelch-repeat protein At1g57790-like n=1 Tax=Lycium barbarum TaxID=112863 RepID=UPI00293F6CE4|nr:F-box/kelch-repeat protein At1g57790-like [Lycium barbarum]
MDTQLTLRDWSKLSDLTLDLIFRKLSSVSDCLCFSAVCKPWFFFVSNNYDALQQRINSSSIEEMPMLMIFISTNSGNLYSVTKGKIVSDLELPLPSTKICCGSSHGWLAFQQSDSLAIHLINPFSSETIGLPSPHDPVDKVILSKNPSTNPYDFEVVATFKSGVWPHRLAILKPGSNAWVFTPHLDISPDHIHDVIYYDDRYYVVTYRGSVLSLDKTTLDFKVINGETLAMYSDIPTKFYLVKTTTNEFLMVQISNRCEILSDEPTSVMISKLVVSQTTQEYMFAELDDLGDEALFLCKHGSMSVSASKFSGCKASSVYYIDVMVKSIGIFVMDLIHFEDGNFHNLFSFETANLFDDLNMPPVLWIIPTPKFTSTSLRHG